MNELERFIAEIKNVHGSRHHQIKNSYDTKDFYRGYIKGLDRDSQYYITERQYGEVLRATNDMLMGRLLDGCQVVFPYNFGSIQIEGYKHSFKIVDGKLRTSQIIDWDSTIRLWYEDYECRKNKTLVRKDQGEMFYVLKYHHSKGRLKNKGFLCFTPCRRITDIINKKMIEGEINVLPRVRYGTTE